MARGARVGVDVSGPSKGYVVRGTWKPREPDPGKPRDVYAWWWELIQDVQWISDREKVPADGRLLFPSIGEADAARCKSSHLSDVAIYRVHLDGREERLPSYEEALGQIERLKDPVDGLEAKLVERTAEREEAREWVRRLTSTTRVLTCAFCGMAYPPGTPESNDAALTAHVRVCPKHPMREAEAEIERLRAMFGADPLTALEAAERRLLEAGGWTAVPDEDYRGYWRDRDGRMCKQAVAILQERRRLAAKGGA